MSVVRWRRSEEKKIENFVKPSTAPQKSKQPPHQQLQPVEMRFSFSLSFLGTFSDALSLAFI
jgi:hypothetical protein